MLLKIWRNRTSHGGKVCEAVLTAAKLADSFREVDDGKIETGTPYNYC